MSDEFVDVYDTEPEGTKASWRNPFEEAGAESAGEPSGRVRRAAAPASARERTASTDEVEKALALILERERDVLVAAMLDPSERTAEALTSACEQLFHERGLVASAVSERVLGLGRAIRPVFERRVPEAVVLPGLPVVAFDGALGARFAGPVVAAGDVASARALVVQAAGGDEDAASVAHAVIEVRVFGSGVRITRALRPQAWPTFEEAAQWEGGAGSALAFVRRVFLSGGHLLVAAPLGVDSTPLMLALAPEWRRRGEDPVLVLTAHEFGEALVREAQGLRLVTVVAGEKPLEGLPLPSVVATPLDEGGVRRLGALWRRGLMPSAAVVRASDAETALSTVPESARRYLGGVIFVGAALKARCLEVRDGVLTPAEAATETALPLEVSA